MSTGKVTLGYWGIRGLAQVSRLLLAYTGAVWEDVKYTSREQWFDKDKKELGLPFPNIPYLIDGDFKLTESKAVNHYIIKRSGKTDLLGKNIKDEAVVESILGVLQDVRTPISPLFWDKEWESKIKAAVEKVSPKLEELDKFYGEKDWALGYLTLADFQIAEFSYYLEKIAPEVYAKHAFLKRTRTAFENLPEIKKYYEQESATKGPFLPPVAAVSF